VHIRRCPIFLAASTAFFAIAAQAAIAQLSCKDVNREPRSNEPQVDLRSVLPNSLRDKLFNANLTPVKSFGSVCRGIRTANELSQKEVVAAGGLDQSRVSEIERGRYLPGLDMAMRVAKGLGVTLTEIVAQWEGTSAEPLPGDVRRRVARRRIPAARA
jgi:ribosome-binding protein aMBF1 (putative translation factor)